MRALLLAVLLLTGCFDGKAQNVNLPPGGASTVTCAVAPTPVPPDPIPVPPHPQPGNCTVIGDLGWTNGNPLHVQYYPNNDYCYTISVPTGAVQFSLRVGEVPGTPAGTNRIWLINPSGVTVKGPDDTNSYYGSMAVGPDYGIPATPGQWIFHVAPNYQGPSVTQLNH